MALIWKIDMLMLTCMGGTGSLGHERHAPKEEAMGS